VVVGAFRDRDAEYAVEGGADVGDVACRSGCQFWDVLSVDWGLERRVYKEMMKKRDTTIWNVDLQGKERHSLPMSVEPLPASVLLGSQITGESMSAIAEA
jgi:hypothetical protein